MVFFLETKLIFQGQIFHVYDYGEKDSGLWQEICVSIVYPFGMVLWAFFGTSVVDEKWLLGTELWRVLLQQQENRSASCHTSSHAASACISLADKGSKGS